MNDKSITKTKWNQTTRIVITKNIKFLNSIKQKTNKNFTRRLLNFHYSRDTALDKQSSQFLRLRYFFLYKRLEESWCSLHSLI